MIDGIEQWKLCKELTLHQAALLIIGANPSEFIIGTRGRLADEDAILPKSYHPILQALKSDILSSKLRADKVKELKHAVVNNRSVLVEKDTLNIEKTTVKVSDLKKWPPAKQLKSKVLFEELHAEDYLNPENPAYSAKLAAAVKAWQAVSSNPSLFKTKSPKQAIEKWLYAHASDFGLLLADGNPNKTGIEEISKVVNWKTLGGAPKTPTGKKNK